MIAFPSGSRVWLATGHTDMRKGFSSLALLAQEEFKPWRRKSSSAIRTPAIFGGFAGEAAT